MYRTALRAFHMPNFCTFFIIALNMNVANGGISLMGFVAYGACRLWGLLLVGFAAYVSCHFWGLLLMWVVFCGGLFHLGVVACGFCCVCGL